MECKKKSSQLIESSPISTWFHSRSLISVALSQSESRFSLFNARNIFLYSYVVRIPIWKQRNRLTDLFSNFLAPFGSRCLRIYVRSETYIVGNVTVCMCSVYSVVLGALCMVCACMRDYRHKFCHSLRSAYNCV